MLMAGVSTSCNAKPIGANMSKNAEVKSDACSLGWKFKMEHIKQANVLWIKENDHLKWENNQIKQNEMNFKQKVEALIFDNERLKEYVIHRDHLVDGYTVKLKEVQ
jgi:FtsZ-binding cell division protein ZapB